MWILMDEEDWHQCHFCGTYVNKEGYSNNDNERHFLSDCRPDLVEHEIGEICTWAFRRKPLVIGKGTPNERTEEALPLEQTCYAYQDSDQKWTKEHIHFYPDGPM
jgi:hypothetical protein